MADVDLVDATLQVIADHGLDGVTIDRLSAAAGVSRATLYRRGVDLGRLLEAATERALETYRDALWPAITGPGDAHERLRAAMLALCRAADPHLGLLVGLFAREHTPFHEDAGAGVTLVREPFAEPFERLLRDGQLDGTLTSQDPVADATVVFNLVSWTYIHLRHAHRWDAEDAARRIVDVVLHGLLADGRE